MYTGIDLNLMGPSFQGTSGDLKALCLRRYGFATRLDTRQILDYRLHSILPLPKKPNAVEFVAGTGGRYVVIIDEDVTVSLWTLDPTSLGIPVDLPEGQAPRSPSAPRKGYQLASHAWPVAPFTLGCKAVQSPMQGVVLALGTGSE